MLCTVCPHIVLGHLSPTLHLHPVSQAQVRSLSCSALTPRLVKYRPVQLCVRVAPGAGSINTDLTAGELAQGSPNLLEAME